MVERVRRAEWGLALPFIFTLLPLAVGIVLFKGFFFLFPKLSGKPHPEWEPWSTLFFTAAVVCNIVVQEMAIINGETADLDEMVRERLLALEYRIKTQSGE